MAGKYSSLVILPAVPPCLALLYAASVQLMQMVWHDADWKYHLQAITVRASLALGTGLASFIGVQHNAIAKAPPQHRLNVGLGLSFLSVASTAWLVGQTRQVYVNARPPLLPSKSLAGRHVLITGANQGIGFETARQLYDAGATVTLGCRSEYRAKEAIASILAQSKDPDQKRLIFLKVDVGNLTSVRSAASMYKDDFNLPLHVLILNAGIMMSDRRQSIDNFELTMACNHLGHFLLTNLLLPLLQKQEDSRVISLTSSTYNLAAAEGINLEDLNCEKRPYSMFSQYAQTKLANILMVKELARREADETLKAPGTHQVSAYAVHPGLVRTDVVRNMPWYLRYPNKWFGFIVGALQKTPEAGAYTSVYCATSSELEGGSGKYYANSRRAPLTDVANDDEVSYDPSGFLVYISLCMIIFLSAFSSLSFSTINCFLLSS